MLIRPSIKKPTRLPAQTLFLGVSTVSTAALSIYLAISAPQFRVEEISVHKVVTTAQETANTQKSSTEKNISDALIEPDRINIEPESSSFWSRIFGSQEVEERSQRIPLHRTQENLIGNGRVTTFAVQHLADIRYNQHLVALNTELIEHKITSHPWIKRAKVTRHLPSRVEIEIEEYKPRLLLSLGLLWYVDSNGEIFRQADSSELNFPVLTGIPKEWATEHPAVVQQILLDSLELLNKCDTPLLGGIDAISEIHFKSLSGFEIVLRNGSVITFGFYEPTSRLERLSKMIVHGLDLSVPQHISLDDDDVAITKPISFVSQQQTGQ